MSKLKQKKKLILRKPAWLATKESTTKYKKNETKRRLNQQQQQHKIKI